MYYFSKVIYSRAFAFALKTNAKKSNFVSFVDFTFSFVTTYRGVRHAFVIKHSFSLILGIYIALLWRNQVSRNDFEGFEHVFLLAVEDDFDTMEILNSIFLTGKRS